MTRRAPQQTLPLEEAAGGTCECCGEVADKLLTRWGQGGLRSCRTCFRANSAELVKAYCQRLRRIVER